MDSINSVLTDHSLVQLGSILNIQKKRLTYHQIVISATKSILYIEASVKTKLNVKSGFTHDVPDALGPVRILVAAVVVYRGRDVASHAVEDATAAC